MSPLSVREEAEYPTEDLPPEEENMIPSEGYGNHTPLQDPPQEASTDAE